MQEGKVMKKSLNAFVEIYQQERELNDKFVVFVKEYVARGRNEWPSVIGSEGAEMVKKLLKEYEALREKNIVL
jgi:hypothetical protein